MQVVLTQVGSELKRPDESVQLTCATSGFNLNDWWMGWLRQKPGKELEWLILYWKSTETIHYLPAIKGRFTASKDSSNFYLQMNRLEPQDTAVYYCARNTVKEKPTAIMQKLFCRRAFLPETTPLSDLMENGLSCSQSD